MPSGITVHDAEPSNPPASTTDEPEAQEASRLRVELRRPPRIRMGMVAAVVLVATLLSSNVVPGLVEAKLWDGLILALFATWVVPLGLVVFLSRAPGWPVIELGTDRLRLPVTVRAYDFATLRYREITELFLRRGKAGFLWIGTPQGTFVYPLRAFSGPEQAEEVAARIRGALEPLPDGPRRTSTFDAQQQTADLLYANRLIGTKVVLGLMLVAFVAQYALQPAGDLFALVDLGANVPALVKDGQLYRLMTGNLLHVGPEHLIINGALILWLGGLVERLFGARTFALVALLAGVLGPAASALSGHVSVAVGTSSVAFGMLGAFAFTTFRMKGNLPLGMSPPMRLWIALGIVLAFMSIFPFGTDFSNHIGGFLAGVLVIAPRLERVSALPVRSAPGPLATGALALLGLVWAAGLVWGGQAALADGRADRTVALADYLERQNPPPELVNQIAWTFAVDPEATPAQLEQARIAAHRAASYLTPDKRHFGEDTVATVYHRLGRHEEAIRREAALLGTKGQDKTYATQLARFLDARLEAEGAPLVDAGLEAGPAARSTYHDNRGFGLELERTPDPEPPRTAWWLVKKDGALQGLLRMPIDSKLQAGQTLWLRGLGIEPVWHAGSRFELAWVQAGRYDAKGWLMDPDVLALP